jgi:hypothetical protein
MPVQPFASPTQSFPPKDLSDKLVGTTAILSKERRIIDSF